MEVFKNKALDHVKRMAQSLAEAEQKFNFFMKKDLIVKSNIAQEQDLLTYKLEEEIIFNDEEKMKMLQVLLYSSNTKTEVGKWIEQAINKGFKDANRDTFDKIVSSILVQKVKVFAENMEYNKMSPGQKSIFGIKYKLNKFNDKYLFLDQPEDNLDNHTIAIEMLEKIKKTKAEQSFIVTHNANIGILTNPENVIVANIENNNNPYECEKIEVIKDDPQAFYLEGGTEYLKQRYKKIIGEKNEN